MPVETFTYSILVGEGVQAGHVAETLVHLYSIMLLTGSESAASTGFQAHRVINQLWFFVLIKNPCVLILSLAYFIDL